MPSTTPQPFRIANMVPPSGSEGFEVPAEAVGQGYASEVFPLSAEISFLNPLDRTVSGLMYTDAGIRAQAAGYSAVVINTVGDYGLRELRAAVGIPAVGAGQSSLQLAASLTDRFAILTVWPKLTASTYQRLLTDNGVAGSCIGVRHVGDNEELPVMWEEGGLVTEMRSLREAALQRLTRGGLDLLEQGAEVITLGCSFMSPAADELRERLGCPVIDPLAAAHKTAELLVGLGLSHPAPAIPSTLSGTIPALFGAEALPPVDDEALCGDTCSAIGASEAAVA